MVLVEYNPLAWLIVPEEVRLHCRLCVPLVLTRFILC